MDDFGATLREARERRGLSLRQIAANTKIASAALDALERNDVSRLPGGIFSRAFVRSYALEVGLDPHETVRQFVERFNQDGASTVESVIAPAVEAGFEHRRRIAAFALKVAAVSLPVLVLVPYFALHPRAGPQSQTAAPAPSVPAVAAAAVAPEAATSPPAVLPMNAALTLDVHPTSDCWVSLTVDGRKVLGRVMQRGEREAYSVGREAVLEVGDAGAFAFAVNGREGKPLGDRGQVRTLTLTAATAARYLQ